MIWRGSGRAGSAQGTASSDPSPHLLQALIAPPWAHPRCAISQMLHPKTLAPRGPLSDQDGRGRRPRAQGRVRTGPHGRGCHRRGFLGTPCTEPAGLQEEAGGGATQARQL